MKKIVIILIVLISINTLSANVMSREMMEEGFKKQISLEKTYFDEMLNVRIEFSQEEYGVDDFISIKFHFTINKEKNIENRRVVIVDYLNMQFHTLLPIEVFKTLTKEDINSRKELILNEDTVCSYVESDPDLILSNDNPSGVYKLKFKLLQKSHGVFSFENSYPYMFRSLLMYSFTETTDFDHLTKYHGIGESLNIPIKLKSSAVKYQKVSDIGYIKGDATELPIRIPQKLKVEDSIIK